MDVGAFLMFAISISLRDGVDYPGCLYQKKNLRKLPYMYLTSRRRGGRNKCSTNTSVVEKDLSKYALYLKGMRFIAKSAGIKLIVSLAIWLVL